MRVEEKSEKAGGGIEGAESFAPGSSADPPDSADLALTEDSQRESIGSPITRPPNDYCQTPEHVADALLEMDADLMQDSPFLDCNNCLEETEHYRDEDGDYLCVECGDLILAYEVEV
jgi:hypothetical protein